MTCSNVNDEQSTELSNAEAPLTTLLEDYSSLLSLIYQSTTKISIALKPSDPTYPAAMTPLKDVTAHTDALASCACSVNRQRHGKTIAREVRWKAEEVINALRTLLDTFIADIQSPGSGAAEMYLAKTGTVHGAVESARSVSRSNAEAVRKRWDLDAEAVNDVVKEIQAAGGTAAANYDDVVNGDRIIETAIKKFGRVDVLINNAGILRDITLKNMKDEDFDKIIAVHLTGTYKTTRAGQCCPCGKC